MSSSCATRRRSMPSSSGLAFLCILRLAEARPRDCPLRSRESVLSRESAPLSSFASLRESVPFSSFAPLRSRLWSTEDPPLDALSFVSGLSVSCDWPVRTLTAFASVASLLYADTGERGPERTGVAFRSLGFFEPFAVVALLVYVATCLPDLSRLRPPLSLLLRTPLPFSACLS